MRAELAWLFFGRNLGIKEARIGAIGSVSMNVGCSKVRLVSGIVRSVEYRVYPTVRTANQPLAPPTLLVLVEGVKRSRNMYNRVKRNRGPVKDALAVLDTFHFL